ncbi:MAG: hypothetical protein AB7O73_04995 [Bacteroidia bacterium]
MTPILLNGLINSYLLNKQSKNTRFIENLHIFFWLLKDTSWVLELKIAGVVMIIPTVSIAIWIMNRTKNEPAFYINLAVLFWICANSYWMCAEFFNFDEYKLFALIPFILGFASFALYIWRLSKGDTNKV